MLGYTSTQNISIIRAITNAIIIHIKVRMVIDNVSDIDNHTDNGDIDNHMGKQQFTEFD
jgi:hypothetical protein